MQALLDVIVPVFVVMGFGYLAVWRGFFSNSDVEGLMKFTQNFAIPCLLFKAIAETDLQNTFQAELLAAFYSGATISFFAGIFLEYSRPYQYVDLLNFSKASFTTLKLKFYSKND